MKGNPVMKAKRVTGPTPNTVLHTLIGVRQVDGTYPVVVMPNGKRPPRRGETPETIINRLKEAIAGRTFLQPREY